MFGRCSCGSLFDHTLHDHQRNPCDFQSRSPGHSIWKCLGTDGGSASYGILYIILTSIVGTALAILIGVPIGILTAVFLAEAAPKKLAAVVKPAVELLAGIPSVIYGLVGILVLNPVMYKLELFLFQNSKTHQSPEERT